RRVRRAVEFYVSRRRCNRPRGRRTRDDSVKFTACGRQTAERGETGLTQGGTGEIAYSTTSGSVPSEALASVRRMGLDVSFPANGSDCPGYFAPADGGGPGVIIIQEWWGIVPHIEDLCD